MNITLIHHNDSDGLLSGAISKRHLSKKYNVTAIEWDYGHPIPDVSAAHAIWMVDISVAEILDREELRCKTHIIDHHKTVVEKWGRYAEQFALWHVDIDFAACRLVAAWFEKYALGAGYEQTRNAWEDHLVFLVGLRDIWKHNGTVFETECQNLELGLRSNWPPDFDFYFSLGDEGREKWIDSAKEHGEAVANYAAAQAKEAADRGAMIVQFSGLRFLCLNSLMRGSMILDAYSRAVLPTMPHDALMVWGLDKEKRVVASFYHAPHNKEPDLSAIAKNIGEATGLGGGGHKGAAGCCMRLEDMAVILNKPVISV